MFLPAAFAGAWATWIVVLVLSRWSLAYAGVESGSFFDNTFQTTSAHTIMGAAFVIIGAKVAPAHRRVVVYILAGIAVLVCGLLLFPAIMVRDWWAIVGALFTAFGAGVALYSVHHDEGFRREYFANDPELGVSELAD